MFKKLIAATCAFGLSLGIAGTAVAGSVDVAHGDLDLSNPADQRALDRRLRHAAMRACTIDGRNPRPGNVSSSCYIAAMADANAAKQAKLDRAEGPALAAVVPQD